jgi:hypothetical protein
MKRINIFRIKDNKLLAQYEFEDLKLNEINSEILKEVSNGTFGKPTRKVIKKGQPFAGEYDDADVLSEEEVQSSLSYERAKYSETETVMGPYVGVDSVELQRENPKYIGQETVPAKFVTMVNLKAEYEISEIIDLDKDPEHIRQKDIEEASYNLSAGETIISKIGGLNLRKQRENTFTTPMESYLKCFSVPFTLLSSGAIETSLIVISTLTLFEPYSKEEMEEMKGFHYKAINERPKR